MCEKKNAPRRRAFSSLWSADELQKAQVRTNSFSRLTNHSLYRPGNAYRLIPINRSLYRQQSTDPHEPFMY